MDQGIGVALPKLEVLDVGCSHMGMIPCPVKNVLIVEWGVSKGCLVSIFLFYGKLHSSRLKRDLSGMKF